jgi:hypothetical protein
VSEVYGIESSEIFQAVLSMLRKDKIVAVFKHHTIDVQANVDKVPHPLNLGFGCTRVSQKVEGLKKRAFIVNIQKRN